MILFFFSLFFRWWIKLVKATLWYNSVSRIYHSVLNLWLFYYFVWEGGGGHFSCGHLTCDRHSDGYYDFCLELEWHHSRLVMMDRWFGNHWIRRSGRSATLSFCTSAVNYCASCQSVSLSFLKEHPWIIMCCAARIYFINSDHTVQNKDLIFLSDGITWWCGPDYVS